MAPRSLVALVALLAAALVLLGCGLAAHFPEEASLEVSAVPWGVLVPGYAFFASVATGSAIVASLYTVFGYGGPGGLLERYAKLLVWLSLVTLVPAWLLILLDLTQPQNVGWLLAGFQPASRVAWMGALYCVLALALLAQLVLMVRGAAGSPAARAAAVIALAAAVAVDTNLGQVFGSLVAVPGWYGPHMAAYFTAGAVVAGAAAQALALTVALRVRGEAERLADLARLYGRVLLVALPALGLVALWSAVTAWYHGEAWQLYRELALGRHAPAYWGLEVAAGLLAPIALAAAAHARASAAAVAAASALALVGAFAAKCDLIIVGQLARLEVDGLRTLVGAGYALAHYAPTASEALLLAGSALLWPALVLAGALVLPLAPGERPRRLLIFK